MKLRYLIASLASAAALLLTAGCDLYEPEREFGNLGVISVDKTQVTIPMEGGSKTVTVTAAASWSIDEATVPGGVTVSPLSGGVGTSTVTFTSANAANDIDGEIKILCSGLTQFIIFHQDGDPALKPQFDPFEGGDFWIMFNVDGKWIVTKPCTAEIGNSGSYAYMFCDEASGSFEDGTLSSTAANVFTFVKVGNAYHLKDSEGGFLYQDSAGKYNNFYRASAGGDYLWTVEQISESEFHIESNSSHVLCYSTGYSNVAAYATLGENVRPYLVPAKDPAPEVLKVPTTAFTLEKEAGKLTVPATVQADELLVESDAAWLRYTGNSAEGLNFVYDANEGGGREAKIIVSAKLGEYSGEATITVTQEGNISEVTVGQILAAEVNAATWYKVTGVVCNLQTGDYGNFDLVDGTGSIYVYGLTATQVAKNDKSFPTLGIKEGDVVTLIGTRAEYNGKAQIGGPAYYDSHISVTKATVAEFNAAPVDAEKWYMLTGTVTDGTAQAGHKFDLATYGNFDLVDEAGSVYVYGLTATKVAKNDKSCGSLELKAGDVVTLIGTRAEYNGAIQVGGPAFFVSKTEGTDPGTGDDNNGGETPGAETDEYSIDLAYTLGASSYDDGVATIIKGEASKEDVKVLKIGTSKAAGSLEFTVPAGTKAITMYAVAWKGAATTLELKAGDTVVATQAIAANDGATGNTPYTITVADSDKYTITLASALEAETKIAVTTADGAKTRAIFWGVKAVK